MPLYIYNVNQNVNVSVSYWLTQQASPLILQTIFDFDPPELRTDTRTHSIEILPIYMSRERLGQVHAGETQARGE